MCLFVGLLCLPRVPAAESSELLTFQVDDRIAIIGNTFADMMRKHGYFESLIQHRYPGYNLVFRNLGWAGDTVMQRARPENFAPEDKWLTDHKTDVIIACFGMGESFAGEVGVDEFRTDLLRIVQHYRQQKYNGQSVPRLILVSPIAYEDLGSITPRHGQRNRDLALYSETIRQVADASDVQFVDLFSPTRDLMNESGASPLTSNGIHPTAYGYWVISQILARRLSPSTMPPSLAIDVAQLSSEVQGATVEQLQTVDTGWQWTVRAWDWPLCPPPANSRVHPSMLPPPIRLEVQNLPSGSYRLVVERDDVKTATEVEWSAGVLLDIYPGQGMVERYREGTKVKNAYFFNGWRALNQVHIVGRRKTSPSGRALPDELREYSRLTEQYDETLRAALTPAPGQQWRLLRSGK